MKIKLLKVTAKCQDLCYVEAIGEDGEIVAERDGYVPDFFPGEHYGDYIEFNIDPATGIILNWDTTVSPEMMIRDLKED